MWKPGWHSTSTHWNLVVPSVHFDSWYLYFTVCSLTMLNLPLVIKMYTVLQPPPGLGNPEIFSFLFLLKPNYGGLEKAMAPRSSTLAWKIPWIEEPGRLQSMGSLGVRHDWATSLSLFTFRHWRRKWQPPPVFLLGESQGQRSLMGCHLWGRTESDMTEAT